MLIPFVIVIGFIILIAGDERPRPAYATCAQLDRQGHQQHHQCQSAPLLVSGWYV
jgi:hypothetical protein